MHFLIGMLGFMVLAAWTVLHPCTKGDAISILVLLVAIMVILVV